MIDFVRPNSWEVPIYLYTAYPPSISFTIEHYCSRTHLCTCCDQHVICVYRSFNSAFVIFAETKTAQMVHHTSEHEPISTELMSPWSTVYTSVHLSTRFHQLRSKPASAFMAYSSFVDICSLLYHNHAPKERTWA